MTRKTKEELLTENKRLNGEVMYLDEYIRNLEQQRDKRKKKILCDMATIHELIGRTEAYREIIESILKEKWLR